MKIAGKIAVLMCFTLILAHTLPAQDVTIAHDTMSADTRGFHVTDAQQWSDSAIIFDNYVFNNSDSAIVFTWQIIENDLPFGWYIHGFCDNAICRLQNDPAITDHIAQQSMPVAAGGNALLEPQIAVPFDGDDGTGILRVAVSHGNDIDTATFIITKNSATGLEEIKNPEQKLHLFPNPAQLNLMVGRDKRLRAAQLYRYNTAGICVLTVAIKPGSDPFPVPVGALASGLYFIRLTDAGNHMVATGKFIKQ